MSRFRDLLGDGRVHVLDGAMGTLLYDRGVFVNVCYDELSLTQPDLIRSLHREYVLAGAEAVETNTFGANPVKLSGHGLEARTEEINIAAARLALEAAGDDASVLGAIGPLSVRIEPWGPTSREEAEALFGRQVDGLLEGGVHGFILETFADIDELLSAIRGVRARSDLPLIAQMTVGEDGRTSFGTTPSQIVEALDDSGADVLGLNCSVGPAVMLDAIESMADRSSLPLSAQPNAGIPRTVGDRKMYLASPEYMAGYARRMIEAGVRFVGGCCGTTPEHVVRMKDQVTRRQPRIASVHVNRPMAPDAVQDWDPVPLSERSALGRSLAQGRFVTTVEVIPPSGWNAEPLFDRAHRLRAAGIDAAVVTDTSGAGSRMGVLPTAALLQSQVELETIAHYTCRDRNMPGMVMDLLGASAAGVRNLLISTGDPSALGPYPDSRAVFDIDSIGLINVIHRLNHGRDPGGSPIGRPTEFVVGVLVRPAPVDPAGERERLRWKIEAGADFSLAGPVFDMDTVHRHLELVSGWDLPALLSVQPLTSLRNAEHLANEVPGVHVPDSVLTRMASAQAAGPDRALDEGVRLATEMAESVSGLVQGLQVRAPSGRVDLALRVVGAFQGVETAARG